MSTIVYRPSIYGEVSTEQTVIYRPSRFSTVNVEVTGLTYRTCTTLMVETSICMVYRQSKCIEVNIKEPTRLTLKVNVIK